MTKRSSVIAGWSSDSKSKKSKTSTPMTKVRSLIKREVTRRSELKEINTGATLLVPNALGSVITLNNIATGTTYATRQGRFLTMKSCQVKFFGHLPTNSGEGDVIKVALVLDKQPNALTPAYTEIYETTTAGAPDAIAFKNTAQNRQRFQVLWEEELFLFNYANGAQLDPIVHNKYWKWNSGKTVQFVNDSATTPETNGLYLVLYSNQATGLATTSGRVSYNAKVLFTDD